MFECEKIGFMLTLFGSFFLLLARLSDLINSNIYISKIFWTKSKFPSKCDLKFDEDKKTIIRSLPVTEL